MPFSATMSQSRSLDDGRLGVVGLHDLWMRWTRRTPHSADPAVRADNWKRDKLLLHGLRLGMEPAARFFACGPTFDQFEDWILALNAGVLDPMQVGRINAVLGGQPYDEGVQRRLDAISAMPPVLDAAAMQTWDEDGVVVLRDALSAAECAAVVDAVYACIHADADNPQTWYDAAYRQGIMVQLFQHPALDAARRSPRVHKAFEQLWGEVDLLPTHDRCGFNPPENDQFQFPGPHLHWDADVSLPLGPGVQGLIYLTDTEADQGAFCCVPGFHKTLDAWLRGLAPGASAQERIRAEATPTPIAGKAGDLILWHHALPHGASRNRTRRPRLVQYLQLFPPRA